MASRPIAAAAAAAGRRPPPPTPRRPATPTPQTKPLTPRSHPSERRAEAEAAGEAASPRAHPTPSPSGRSAAAAPPTQAAAAVAGLALLLAASPASAAFTPTLEPSNALSLPTWAIHVSSVLEWCAAMGLFVKLAAVRKEPSLAGMAWGMLPLLAGALAACTFHFFYNAPALYPMVAVQAGLTVGGNATMAVAAWRIWAVAEEEKEKVAAGGEKAAKDV